MFRKMRRFKQELSKEEDKLKQAEQNLAKEKEKLEKICMQRMWICL